MCSPYFFFLVFRFFEAVRGALSPIAAALLALLCSTVLRRDSGLPLAEFWIALFSRAFGLPVDEAYGLWTAFDTRRVFARGAEVI